MKKLQRRFTLVEILMVAAMICLIMAVILIAYNGVYRSWASGNTAAVMKSAQLPLDKYKQENNGVYPAGKGTLGSIVHDKETLKKELLQACSPLSYMNGNTLQIFDDFGDKPPKTPQEIYYISPLESRNTFMLMSMGKNGEWGGDDDIIFLPHGHDGHNLRSGFYVCNVNEDGTITGEIEPMAQ